MPPPNYGGSKYVIQEPRENIQTTTQRYVMKDNSNLMNMILIGLVLYLILKINKLV